MTSPQESKSKNEGYNGEFPTLQDSFSLDPLRCGLLSFLSLTFSAVSVSVAFSWNFHQWFVRQRASPEINSKVEDISGQLIADL